MAPNSDWCPVKAHLRSRRHPWYTQVEISLQLVLLQEDCQIPA
jgi:hypothetical protein